MLKWQNYFMAIAEETAKLSKDPRTKVGAIIVKNNKILSLGFNGAPMSFNDDLVPMDNNSQNIFKKKNTYIVHAELNAILNYSGNLSNFKDAEIYVSVSPCYECLKAIAQVGIKKVIYKVKHDKPLEYEVMRYIAKECNIEVIQLED